MPIKSAVVFCGYSFGNSPLFKEHAGKVGNLLAENGITLVYGGAKGGLMGEVADSALSAGGKVIGIIPQGLKEQEHPGLTELIRTPNLESRKKLMFDKADLAIALPGGYGTINEIFELLNQNVHGLIDKKLIILNTNHFYDGLITQLGNIQDAEFLSGSLAGGKVTTISEPEDIVKYLK